MLHDQEESRASGEQLLVAGSATWMGGENASGVGRAAGG
jgi:hypothetical protein